MRGILIAGLLLAAAPTSAATIQQDFDAAQAALARGEAQAAAALFEQLLRRMPKASADPQNYSAAAIRAGLGQARAMSGDVRGARVAYEAALTGLRSQTPDERQVLASALAGLGGVYELQVEFADARRVLNRSLALNAFPGDDPITLRAQLTLARVSIFDDPDLAVRMIDAALPILHKQLLGDRPGPKRDTLGDVYALRGRIHLNRRQYAEARNWFDRALQLAGGLGSRVTVADTRIRSDLAIAYHLLGDTGSVKRFLASSFAGRANNDPTRGADTPLPVCGDLTGIRPDDMAIVEFGIMANGRVHGVVPIYATRPEIAAEFARAVNSWSWRPDAVAELDPFWRAAVRLELRCSNSGGRPQLSDGLRPSVGEFLQSKGVAINSDLTDAEALPVLQRELEDRSAKHGDQSLETLPVLIALGRLSTVDESAKLNYLQKAAAIARKVDAPLEVRVIIDVAAARLLERPASTQSSWARQIRARLTALLAELSAAGQGLTLAAAYVRMELAAVLNIYDRSAAERLYREVTAMPAGVVPEANPIRQAALLQLASFATEKHRTDEATQLVNATGLSPNQCAMADVRPARTGGRISPDDVPNEAIRWGISGWAKISYDIDVNGVPVRPRTVMAYPPFVFGTTSERNIQKLRYQPFPKALGQVGCANQELTLRYTF